MDLLDVVAKMLRPLKSRIMLMISRGVVTLVKDGEKIQEIQASVMVGEVQDGVEHFQNFGFTSTPLPGTECIIVYLGGERDHPIAIAVDDPFTRPNGQPAGSSTQYDAFGGKNELIGGDHKVTALTKSEILAPSVVLGSGSITEKILNGETFQTFFNSHAHLAFGVPTTPPTLPSLPVHLSAAVKAATLLV